MSHFLVEGSMSSVYKVEGFIRPFSPSLCLQHCLVGVDRTVRESNMYVPD